MYNFTIGTETKYDVKESRFSLAFDFLKRKDLTKLEPGWYKLGNGVKASVQHYITADWNDIQFETHEDFIDVQYVVEGVEHIGFCTRYGLEVAIPYDKENDIAFYKEPKESGKVLLRAGDLAIFTPEDAQIRLDCGLK